MKRDKGRIIFSHSVFVQNIEAYVAVILIAIKFFAA